MHSLSNINNITAFGCSHTAGIDHINREKTAWPIVLGELFNLPVNNYAVGSSSNEEIIYTCIKHYSGHFKNSLIVILVTHLNRIYLPKKISYDIKDDCKGPVYESISHWNKNDTWKMWIKHHYDIQNVAKYTWHLYSMLYEIMRYKKHKVYIFNLGPYNINQNFYANITFKQITNQYPIHESGHSLEEGHQAWANHVYKTILETEKLT